MADAMDSISIEISNHHFHHECIINALDTHMERAQWCTTDAVAKHNGHGSGFAIGFTENIGSFQDEHKLIYVNVDGVAQCSDNVAVFCWLTSQSDS